VDVLTDTELFRALAALGWIDRVALGIVVIAALRGLWIGLLREAFSLGAVAAAFVSVKLWTDSATAWLLEHAPFDLSLSDREAHVLGGALVGLTAAFVVVAIGGFVCKRAHANGLGVFDRLLGGALGGAEGALFVAVALIGVVALVGPHHAVLAGSRSIELLARARLFADELPNVAAPPPEEDGAPPPRGGDGGQPTDGSPRKIEFERGRGDEVSV
jgi:membrane protein required for colicin V production